MELAEQLWAIEEIKQLKSRYFQAVDEKDYVTIAALFTPDAVVDFTGELRHHVGHHGVTQDVLEPAPRPVIGGVATAAVISDAIDHVVSVHHGHDPRIEVTSPARARGRWSLHDILEYDEETMHGFGHYVEEYARDADGWRFTSLRLTRLRVAWTPRSSTTLVKESKFDGDVRALAS